MPWPRARSFAALTCCRPGCRSTSGSRGGSVATPRHVRGLGSRQARTWTLGRSRSEALSGSRPGRSGVSGVGSRRERPPQASGLSVQPRPRRILDSARVYSTGRPGESTKMAKTPDDRKSQEAEARRAEIRIVVRNGVRVDGRNPANKPAESTSPTPAAAPGSTRHDRDPQRDAINEALRRYRPARPPTPRTDEELRRRQREHLERVHARRGGGSTREVDCLHNQCPLCWGTLIKANGERCIHMIACGCPRCSPRQLTLLATGQPSRR